MTIKCNCGRIVSRRPNANGVVICPRCKATHSLAEFEQATEREEYAYDMRTAKGTLAPGLRRV